MKPGPEFINRIDEIIVFQALTMEQLKQITRLMLDRVARRLRAQHIEVEFSDEAVEHLAEIGFDPEFGARPLRRAIQRELENEVSRPVRASRRAGASPRSRCVSWPRSCVGLRRGLRGPSGSAQGATQAATPGRRPGRNEGWPLREGEG
jgi:hypothetical protein